MIELESSRITPELARLFDPEIPNRPMVLGVLEGFNPGRILLDRVDAPTWCVVRPSWYGPTFVGGRIGREALTEAIVRLAQQARVWVVVREGDPLRDLLPAGAWPIFQRLEFSQRDRAGAPVEGSLAALPAGCRLRRMDDGLFERARWRDFLVEAMGGRAAFLDGSVGYAVTRGDEILSEAYCVFRGGGQAEIGVVTQEGERRRGYAFAACAGLVREIEGRGLAVLWSCDTSNSASVALARKLGFRRERAYEFVCYQNERSVAAPRAHAPKGA